MIDVLVVDDEELARMRLGNLISECTSPQARVVGELGSVAHALVWLAQNRCDLVLLDIQMPGADGLQLAATLRARAARGEPSPAVVFVTAHAQHALKAFDLEAVDYLTKPVRRERLQATLVRVEQRLKASLPPASTPTADAGSAKDGAPTIDATAVDRRAVSSGGTTGAQAAATGTMTASATGASPKPLAAPPSPVLIVSERGRVVRVPLREVLYLKAELKYVTLRTHDSSYILDDALSDLEQRLGPDFMRIHRNALVSRRAVVALQRRSLPAEGTDPATEGWAVRVHLVNEWLAVSRRLLPAVREAIAAHGV